MTATRINYFAYGSNMCTARLAARVPAPQSLGPAILTGHRLALDLAGGDDSAKCNVVATGNPDDVVQGVCFSLDSDQLDQLHAAEGPAYEFIELDIGLASASARASAGERVTAAVYRGLSEWRISDKRPYQWYLDYVLAGAREHGLTADWIDFLAGHPTTVDPDTSRRTSNQRALSDA